MVAALLMRCVCVSEGGEWVHKFVRCRIALLLQHVNIFYLHLDFPLTKRDEDWREEVEKKRTGEWNKE